MRRPCALRGAAGLLALALLSGCGFEGVYSLPLPGAKASGDDTYKVTVEFNDVLNLVPYSAVKVNNATVGHVADIRLVDGHAEVVCQLLDKVALPTNAIGEVAETSLLGEKYVSLTPPTDAPPRGRLHDGDVVPLTQTSAGATVEEVLSALSLVLNGGGLAQVKTITTELNRALTGREDGLRDALESLNTFVAGLDAQKADIIHALEGVDQLSATLADQHQVLTDALDHLPPALEVLADQRRSLTTMLVALDKLGTVGTHVINASSQDLLANLKDLQPTLTNLAAASEDIPKSLDVLATYPFATGSDNVFHGDYGNVWLTIDLYPPQLAKNFGLTGGSGQGGLLPSLPLPGLPSTPSTPSVPGLPTLPDLPTIPGLPDLPGLLGGGSTPSADPSPSEPALPSKGKNPLSDIGHLLFGGLG